MALCDTKNDIKIKEDDLPPVPRKLRAKLMRLTLGARRILIKEPSTTKGSWKQLNALNLRTNGPRVQPDDGLESIAETVVAIMHERWLELNNSDEPAGDVRYLVMAERCEGARGQQKPSFEFVWDEKAASVNDDDYGDEDDVMRRDVLLDIIDRLSTEIDMRQAHRAENDSTMIEMMRMNFEPIAASSSMLRDATQMMGHNFTMLQHMLTAQYSQEAARAEQEEKTKRSEATWDRLDKYFAFASTAVGSQIGTFLKKKFGGTNVASESEIHRGKQAAAQTQDDKEDGEEDGEEDENDEDEADTIEHPVAVMCEVFGSSLNPKQRKRMRAVLDEETYALFDELFCAETDDEAIELFKQIKDTADTVKLLEMFSLLDAEQVELYNRVSEIVASTEKPDVEDEEDDEDDA